MLAGASLCPAFRRILERSAYAVEAVPDLPAALDAILRGAPDLVLAEAALPGLALLRRLRADPAARDTPVILIADRTDAAAYAAAFEAGADDYLAKPVGAQAVLARIGAAFRQARTRKDQDRALRENQARLELAQSAAEIAIWDWDIVADRVVFNAQYYVLCGLPEGAPHGYAEFLAMVDPGDRARVDANMRGALAGGGSYESEFRLVRPDGAVRWMAAKGRVVFDSGGAPVRAMGIMQDITGRKRIEEALERTRFMLSEGQRIAHVGSFEYLAATGTTVWSDEECRIYGLAPGAPSPSYEALLARFLVPDDAEILRATFAAAVESGAIYELEHRIVRPSGEVRLVQDRAYPYFDEHGRLVRYVGATLDITEIKRAEAALRESEARFRAMADNIAQLAWMADAGGTLFWYNRRWHEYTGSTPETMQGQGWQAVHHPGHVGRVTARWHASIQSGEPWEDIFPLRGKDGEYRWFLSRALPIRDGAGQITLWFGTNTDITEQKEQQERIEHLAFHDPLTQLPNRAFFRQRLAAALAHAERRGERIAVFVLDLDHFKQINDSLGHLVGDALLKEVARRMRACVRDQDCVARQGGDEFMLVLPDTDADGAAHAAEKIVKALAETMDIDGYELNIGCSLGISLYPDNGRDANSLIQSADVAMYRAKQRGRNAYQFFTEEMQREALRTLTLEHELRRALKRDELLLYYQPQVDIENQRVVGCEALLRWRHPDRGLVEPSLFIPLAEENGLILDIGLWVLRAAATQMKAWGRCGQPAASLPVSVNLSAAQFRHDRQRCIIGDQVAKVLEETGIAPDLLELEITETCLMEGNAWTQRILGSLREMGVRLAIDDFGTGYSSLAYLKQFPVDRLKIDQSFVRDIAVDAGDEAIVDTIISLGRNFKLKVIAEGVESGLQLRKLRNKGCHEAQGYYFSRPLPASEMMEWLLNNPGGGTAMPSPPLA